ncbi:MAG: hypothetical protein AAF399_26755, partial [Bacteroidota bacterium]
MRTLFNRFMALLLAPSQKGQRQGVVLLISFSLALILWLLAALNQEYTSTLTYPIRITEVP